MVLNEYKSQENDLFPSIYQSVTRGYPDRQYSSTLVSDQSSDTAQYLNNPTITSPSFSVEGNESCFTLEDISAQDTGYDGDVEVVTPYEYEEAESRPLTPQRTKSRTRKDAETDDLGKAGLIDAMRALDCDSDITDYGSHGLRIRRGQKRKGRYSYGGQSTPDCSSDTGDIEIIDLERGGRVFTSIKSRKRRRRRAYTSDTSDSQNAGKSSVEWGSTTHVPRGNKLNGAVPPRGDKMDIG